METRGRTEHAAAPVDTVTEGGLLLRRSTPADDDELLELFRRVFGPDVARSRNAADWRWRYRQSAAETQSCVAVDAESDQVVGHVGGRSHATLWHGTTRRSIECVDDMVDPSARSGLRRRNVFATLKLFWVDHFCGPDKNVFGWGFPNEVAFRIGRQAAAYHRICDVTMLVCRREDRLAADVPGVEVRRVAAITDDTDELFAACEPDLRIAVLRDREYLSRRYCRRPGRPYAVFEARDRRSEELRGVHVLRASGIAHDAAMSMDWVVPLADADATTALLAAASRFVREQKLGALVAWFPDTSEHFREFRQRGFEPTPSPMFVAGRSWDPDAPIDGVARNLYMTFGDMDSF